MLLCKLADVVRIELSLIGDDIVFGNGVLGVVDQVVVHLQRTLIRQVIGELHRETNTTVEVHSYHCR